MLATPGKAFTHKDWVFELKYDGYRLFAEKAEGRVTLYSRAGHDFTQTFPDVAEFVAALPYEHFIIDGEVIINDARGHSELRAAAKTRANHSPPRSGARGSRAPLDVVRVRSARVRRPGFALPAVGRAQGGAARGVADHRPAALLRARRGARGGDVRRSRAHGARGRRRQARRLDVREQAVAGLGEGQRGEVRRLRGRRLLAREERRGGLQRAVARAVSRRRAHLRGPRRRRLRAARFQGDRAAGSRSSRPPLRRPRLPRRRARSGTCRAPSCR